MTSLNKDLSQYWNQDPDRDYKIYESIKSHNGIDCNCCTKTRNRPEPKLRDKSKTKRKRIRRKTRHGKLSQVEIDLAKGLIRK